MQYLGEVAESAKFLTNGMQQYFGRPPQRMDGIYDDVVGFASDNIIEPAANAYNSAVDYTSETIIPGVVDAAPYAYTALNPAGAAAGYFVDHTGDIIDAAGNAVQTVEDAAGNLYDTAGNVIGSVSKGVQQAASTLSHVVIFGAILAGLVVFGPEIRATLNQFHKKG
jgi:hypothetical protein